MYRKVLMSILFRNYHFSAIVGMQRRQAVKRTKNQQQILTGLLLKFILCKKKKLS